MQGFVFLYKLWGNAKSCYYLYILEPHPLSDVSQLIEWESDLGMGITANNYDDVIDETFLLETTTNVFFWSGFFVMSFHRLR